MPFHYVQRKPTTLIERIAIHEAGHAVSHIENCKHLCDLPIDTVRIYQGESGAGGEVTIDSSWEFQRRLYINGFYNTPDEKGYKRMWRFLPPIMAGYAADYVISGLYGEQNPSEALKQFAKNERESYQVKGEGEGDITQLTARIVPLSTFLQENPFWLAKQNEKAKGITIEEMVFLKAIQQTRQAGFALSVLGVAGALLERFDGKNGQLGGNEIADILGHQVRPVMKV